MCRIDYNNFYLEREKGNNDDDDDDDDDGSDRSGDDDVMAYGNEEGASSRGAGAGRLNNGNGNIGGLGGLAQ